MRFVDKIRDITTAGDSGDWTDPAVSLVGEIPIRDMASGVRFAVVAVAASGAQIADAGVTYTYQLFRDWLSGGVIRRAFSASMPATIGKLYDDNPVSRGEGAAPGNVYVRVSGFSSTAGVDHFELHGEAL